MSVNIYARATKLTDVCGRVDYASNPDKQEHLLAVASTVEQDYWEKLAADSQAAFLAAGGKRLVRSKTGKMVPAKCCEARELVIDLPNDAQDQDLQQLAQEIVAEFKARTGADCMVAIHLNEAENNLHIHLIFSERELLEEPEIRIADRNAFIDEEGRRRRTKKEILDADGQLRSGCRIVPKGEVISARYFGDKNPMFKDRGWLYSYKHDAASWINERLDPSEKREVFDKFGPYLAQRKVGKAIYSKDPAIRKVAEDNQEWNRAVKDYNNRVRTGQVKLEDAHLIKTQISLAPNQLLELQAVLADIRCQTEDLRPDERAALEALAKQAGLKKRTMVDLDAAQKAKLRDAYRRAHLARQQARMATDNLEKRIKWAEARAVSSEIHRLRRDLGYNDPLTTRERRSAVWDAFADERAAYAENEKLKAYKERVAKNRAAAAERLGTAKLEYQALGRRASRSEKEAALKKIDEARSEYAAVKKESQMLNQAYRLQQQYRSFALELASDPNVPQEDANRALEKYKIAARRLQNPTEETIRELQRHLSDLQRSQKLRDDKRKKLGGPNGGAGGDIVR